MKTQSKSPRRKSAPPPTHTQAADLARQYSLVLERSGAEFVGTIKELRGVIVRGKTANECEEKALEAAELAIDALLHCGHKPPVPERLRRAQLNFRLSSEELELVKLASQARGFKTVSDFGRAAILAAAHGL